MLRDRLPAHTTQNYKKVKQPTSGHSVDKGAHRSRVRSAANIFVFTENQLCVFNVLGRLHVRTTVTYDILLFHCTAGGLSPHLQRTAQGSAPVQNSIKIKFAPYPRPQQCIGAPINPREFCLVLASICQPQECMSFSKSPTMRRSEAIRYTETHDRQCS